MIKTVLIIFVSTTLLSCYRTESGLVIGLPDYEKRNIEVSQVDLDILFRADALLKDETAWSKEENRRCGKLNKLSLFCALQKASIEVNGNYAHRQAALQEVRFVVDDKYKNRWKVHRLADFNAHPETSFDDVKNLIAKAIEKVNGKLQKTGRSSRH